MNDIPEINPEDLPACHAVGSNPQGYNEKNAECHNCPDKFSCLPAAIDADLVKLRLSVDREVEAVVQGRMAFMDAIERMKRRLARMKAKEEIRPEERTDWEGLADGLETPEPEVAEDPPIEDLDEDDGGHDEPAAQEPEPPKEEAVTKSKPAKSPPKKPAKKATKPKAKKAEKSAPKKPPKKPESKAEAKPAEKAKKATPKPKKEKPAPVLLHAVPANRATLGTKFTVRLDSTDAGRIELTEAGWGWFTRADESPECFDSYSVCLSSFGRFLADKKGVKVAVTKEARAAVKVANAERKAAEKAAKSEAKPKAKKAAKPKAKAQDGRGKHGNQKGNRTSRRGTGKAMPEGWPEMRDGRPYPQPAQLSEEEMQEKLAATQRSLGANIELDYGMQLVRKTRRGEVVCVIRPNGFEFKIPHKDVVKAAKLRSSKQLFGSLSSVAQWWEGRLRTGTDFFNIAKHNCTEVRDEGGEVIDRRGGV